MIIVRTLPSFADSRISRIAEACSDGQSRVLITHERGLIKWWHKRNSDGKVVKALKYLYFIFFVISYNLLRLRPSQKSVVFMDLDTIIFGGLLAKVLGYRIFFDVVDPFAYTKLLNLPFLWKLSFLVEAIFIRFSDIAIFPLEQRVRLYPWHFENVFIFENVPYGKICSTEAPSAAEADIGYFGTLDAKGRGIEEVIDFCIREEMTMLIAGAGALEEKIRIKCEAHTGIHFLGRYEASELCGLYEKVRFSFAFYSDANPLHRFAAPNKYYEHLKYHTPIITSNVIPQASDIDGSTGIVLENLNDLSREKLEQLDYESAVRNCKKIWSDRYTNYSERARKEWLHKVSEVS